MLRPKQRDVLALLGEIETVLAKLLVMEAEEAPATLRDRVRLLVKLRRGIKDYGTSLFTDPSAKAARSRILAYLKEYAGEAVDAEELEAVAGISEWARRVRELRVEHGYNILTGYTRGDLRRDQYLLLNPEPDEGTARRWRLANEIRRGPGGAKVTMLRYLRENVGIAVTGDELQYIAGSTSEWARRIRELRTEEGWPVYTKLTGRSDLGTGEYVLEADRQLPAHDRRIPDTVRAEVLDRDRYRCRVCRWGYDQRHPGDPRQFLELHHIKAHLERGPNLPENLITLCNMHHDRVHAGDRGIIEELGFS